MKNKNTLPENEVRYLDSLEPRERNSRLLALNNAGWSLSVLGRSLSPVRPKTTVHFWIKNAEDLPQIREIPSPPPKTLRSEVPTASSTRYRSISPKVPPSLKGELRGLADLARKYRSRTPPGYPSAVANESLTAVAKTLRDMGVPTAEIAKAAGVSYRAMARRLSK